MIRSMIFEKGGALHPKSFSIFTKTIIMTQILSSCGLICNECEFYGNQCAGCYRVKGAPFWAAEHTAEGICPLFKCAVVDKKYNSCGQCPDLPCELFIRMQDPNTSDEEHQKSLKERVTRLKEQLKA